MPSCQRVPGIDRHLLWLAGLTAVVAWLAITGSRMPGGPAAIWPLSGMLLALLLRRPRRRWGALVVAYLLGTSLGSVLAGNQAGMALGLALCGAAEPLAVAWFLLRKGARRVDLAHLPHLRLFGLAALVAPLPAAVPAALLLWGLDGAAPATAIATWYAAHLLGLAIVTPLALALLAARGRPVAWLRAAPGALLLLAAVTAAVVAISATQLFYLVAGPVLLVVHRLRGPGAAISVALVVAIAVPFTALGLGPLGEAAAHQPLPHRLVKLQLFLLFLSVLAQVFAALLTQSDRMQEALRRRKQEGKRKAALLEAVLGAMEQGLAAYDARGRLLAANDRYADLVGLPRALVVPGVHYLDLARWLAAQGAYGPGDAEALAQERYRAVSSGRLHRSSRTTAAGRAIAVTGRPLPGGGFVNTFSDVTGTMDQARALAASEAQFRMLAEHSSDVVMRIGLDGTVHYASPAAERVLQRPPDAVVGRHLSEVVHPEDVSWAATALDPLVRGEAEETTTTYRAIRPDESQVWLEERARLIRAPDGRPLEVVAVLRDATDRKAMEEELLATLEQLRGMAQTDGLTGLANRRRFDEVLPREWRRAARDGQPLSVLLLDVDRFKPFNDRYGHAAGDACLRVLAGQLAAAARRPGDLAARYGGEEFALLLPGTDALGAVDVAERVRELVMTCGVPHEDNPPAGVVTASIGVATVLPWPDVPPDPEGLLAAADAALYAAKSAGRNRVVRAPLAMMA